MVDSSKFAEFIDQANDKLEQIKLSLLRHEKNPKDREFLNDIYRSVRSIKTAALIAGLGRVPELCFHLESLLDLIRQERMALNHDILDILGASKDRLTKLVREVDTSGNERATIKDILKRIQHFEESAGPAEAQQPPPVIEIASPRTAPKMRRKPGPVLADRSLLPDEIINRDYDEELFQIFIDQMQENLSMLRTLAGDYPGAPGKAKVIALASDLVGKLQSSAHYMGYERLAEFYLQWIAELEMAGVDLAIGNPVSIDFLDDNIKKITSLFPQIQDKAADPSTLVKIEQDLDISPPKTEKIKVDKTAETDSFKALFSEIEEEDSFAEESEPIAALAGFEAPSAARRSKPREPRKKGPVMKNLTRSAQVVLDASFLEEEKQRDDYDEELFQIFIEQVQENLSQLRTLTDSFPQASNKPHVVSLCSILIDKLQASANYMGYEQLVAYYVQWVAELEMVGVDLTMGNEVSFAFMDRNINKIVEIFPQVKDVPAEVVVEINAPEISISSAAERRPPEEETDETDTFRDLFSTLEEDEEEVFDEDAEPIAALSGDESLLDEDLFDERVEPEKAAIEQKAEPGSVLAEAEAIAEDFFAAVERGTTPESGWGAAADIEKPAAGGEDDFLFGEFDEGEEESFEISAEPIAALADEELFAESAETEEPMAGDEDFGDLFGDEGTAAEEELTVPGPDRAEQPESEEEDNLFTDFEVDEEEFDVESASLEALADSSEEAAEDVGEKAKPSLHLREEFEDIDALFGEGGEEEDLFAEEETPVSPTEPQPGRRELYEKLSDALKSLEEEPVHVPGWEDEDEETGRPGTGVAPKAEPEPAEEHDSQLFNRLIHALEATAEDDDRSAAKPIDQVIEEILTHETAPLQAEAAQTGTVHDRFGTAEIRQSLGLDAGNIDDLMNKIGELVASRASLSRLYSDMNSLHHRLLEQEGADAQQLKSLQELIFRLGDTNTALGRVSGEIKEGILKVRMLPAGQLFSLYEDLVADLAGKSGKQVELEITGEDTGIDHCTLEDISFCLLHLVRNAVEHGIEPAAERRKSGKKETAIISLNAYHERNHLVVEVMDDGRGIDPKKIKASALALGLFTGDDLYRMSDRELTRLIMTPGLTTVKDAPGRGPGMDQVKSRVEKLKGAIEIRSKVGKSTRIRLIFPLNLPVFQALKIKVGSGCFAVPLSSVEEVLRLRTSELSRTDGAEQIRFHGEDIPVYALGQLINIESATRGERFYVIVVSSDTRKAGLIVDTIIGLEDVAIKPLAEFLRKESGFSGAAIKGEDDISLIPDIAGLMNMAAEKNLRSAKQDA